MFEFMFKANKETQGNLKNMFVTEQEAKHQGDR